MPNLPQYELVLLGAGHTNAHIIRMWRMNALPGARLTCVANFPAATYSGMLPGTLAGQYEPGDMEIDLLRLCASCGVRLIVDAAVAVDAARQNVQFDHRPPLPFDVLSIGIGSRPMTAEDPAGLSIAIKPMQTFLERLDQRLHELAAVIDGRPWRIAIIGGGAAGFEIACCLRSRIERRFVGAAAEISILDGGDTILDGFHPRARSLAEAALADRNIAVRLDVRVTSVTPQRTLAVDSGEELPFDLAIWATSARPPALLDRVDLPKDDKGFLLTRNTLQSTGSDAIFVVGDSGTCDEHRRPKSGVFAVRQAPVLWENLRRIVTGQSLREWQPQKEFLRLLNTGDGQAILSYHNAAFRGAWCWRLKDWIDRRFMAKYQDYRPLEMNASMQSERDATVYCGGCGCKTPAAVLHRVLDRLDNPKPEHVIAGLDDRDDVGLIRPPDDAQTAITTDFFTAPIDDAWLFGRIAAENSLSDLYAKNIRPQAALAQVAIPHGNAERQSEYLYQVLHGALEALRPAGAPLVGGHTIETDEPLVGFTLVGAALPNSTIRKGGLQPGDQLLLTKPLGTGVLLAGRMEAQCEGDWFQELIRWMLVSNQAAAATAAKFGVVAMTDVTGFGLAGHLLEMLQASRCAARIGIDNIPALPGALDLIRQGIASSLAPGNRAAASAFRANTALLGDPRTELLIDPQTSGGLLLGVPREAVDRVMSGFPDAWIIGEAEALRDSDEVVTVTLEERIHDI